MPLRSYDETCMKVAIEEAARATQEGHMPFGACLADADGRIVARAHNQCPTARQRGGALHADVTRHAEMELVRGSTDVPAQRDTLTLYTSTEPCVMCAGAIYWSGVGRLVYGCSAQSLEEKLSGPGGFDIAVRRLYGMASAGARPIEIVGPLLEEESLRVHDAAGVWKYSLQSKEKTQEEKKTTTASAAEDIAVEASLQETGLGIKKVVDDNVVPTIDLTSGTKEEVAAQLWKAATEVGFFTVTGHGIDQELIDSAFAVSESVFAQSLEDKKKASPLNMSINCGFESFSQVRPSTGVADQKESLQVTARAGCMDGRWPSDNFRETAQALLSQAHQLANRILDLLEPHAVPHLPTGTLSGSHELWGPDGQCTLRFLHYPALSPGASEALWKKNKNYWRAGPHTDWDNVTLLFQRPGQSGLECCANPRTGDPSQMYWTAVNPVEGGIAVNIGDMLARWTDGKLYSNLHRVRLPLDASKPRYSIAYFAQSNQSTLIECQNSEHITAGDYILSRIRSNFVEKT